MVMNKVWSDIGTLMMVQVLALGIKVSMKILVPSTVQNGQMTRSTKMISLDIPLVLKWTMMAG